MSRLICKHALPRLLTCHVQYSLVPTCQLIINLSWPRGFGSRPLRDNEMFKRAQTAALCLPCEPDRRVVPVTQSDGSIELEPWPIIRPTELLKPLLDSGYRDALLPTAKEVRKFWRLWLQDHPDDEFQDPSWAPYFHRVIPFQLWGDEGTLRESSWMLLSMSQFYARNVFAQCHKPAVTCFSLFQLMATTRNRVSMFRCNP